MNRPAIRSQANTVLGRLTPYALAVLLTTGCSTLAQADWRGSARDAFLDPATLVPLAGAAVFAIGDFDEEVSDWASDETPVFGSQNSARDASDVLRGVLVAEGALTMLLRPDPELAVDLAAFGSTVGMTVFLKSVTDRERPDEADDKSFPSGHTSQSFSAATIANRNLTLLVDEQHRGLGTALRASNWTAASLVGWARVEGEEHFPSDVFFGAALGHFITSFVQGVFGRDLDSGATIAFTPHEGGLAVRFSASF